LKRRCENKARITTSERETGEMTRPIKLGKADVPPVELAKGMRTQYNICHETVISEKLRMGVCHHAPDMADLIWQGMNEEAFYVVRGSIRLIWESSAGEKGDLLAKEGEQIYLPKGLRYILRATGEPAVNVFAISGDSTSLVPIVGRERANEILAATLRLRS
jgi:uncharacterized RmlC-like cupin family protein